MSRKGQKKNKPLKKAPAEKEQPNDSNIPTEDDQNKGLHNITEQLQKIDLKQELEDKNSKIERATRLTFYPFAYALYEAACDSFCWYCLKESKNPEEIKHCLGCHEAVFCNSECQQLGWKDHRAECAGIKATGMVPDVEVRMLGRIVLRYKDIEKGKDKDPNFYKDRHSRRKIMEICTHTEKMAAHPFALKKFDAIYDGLIKFYKPKYLLPRDVVFELHCRNFINRHGLSDAGYRREVGKGLYLDLCQYNHSCRPNSVYTHNGFVATLRALNSKVDLNNIEETTYTYVELSRARQDRRELLRASWYFECQCARCTDEKDHFSSSIKCPFCIQREKEVLICVFGNHVYKNNETGIIHCPECERPMPKSYITQCVNDMKDLGKEFNSSGNDTKTPVEQQLARLNYLDERYSTNLSTLNIYYCGILQKMITLMDPHNIEECLRLLLLTEPCVRFSFPRNHPALGFHLNKIATYYFAFHDYAKSEKYALEAKKILEFVMDNDHDLVLENNELLMWNKLAVVTEAKRLKEDSTRASHLQMQTKTKEEVTKLLEKQNRSLQFLANMAQQQRAPNSLATKKAESYDSGYRYPENAMNNKYDLSDKRDDLPDLIW